MERDALESPEAQATVPCSFRWAVSPTGERELVLKLLVLESAAWDIYHAQLEDRLRENMRFDGFTRGRVVDFAGHVLFEVEGPGTGEAGNDAKRSASG